MVTSEGLLDLGSSRQGKIDRGLTFISFFPAELEPSKVSVATTWKP